MKKAKKIISSLNKLLIVNHKTEKIFLNALDEVDNIVLKNFFRVSSYERNQFIKSIDFLIREKGGIPTYPQGVFDSNNLLSLNLSEIISTKDEQFLFTEIGRMQVIDIEKYQKALNKFDFPEEIEKLLEGQKNTIVKSLYSIEVHKDLFAKNIVSF
ncbi:conserved hypothetical protein [Flaviramulus basaltis]|uniref:DUF2383 domain-containing protein n=1 Tax=Flaviramulus basaltis TaxID=369401 RepID=A0A1K2IAY0_9FLAO|nr:DUF2383 domain-containing protein [Flaviramulus basaltis]SFZ89565.1 conserved hypothetical protein [Flaviramulus basaltis]